MMKESLKISIYFLSLIKVIFCLQTKDHKIQILDNKEKKMILNLLHYLIKVKTIQKICRMKSKVWIFQTNLTNNNFSH